MTCPRCTGLIIVEHLFNGSPCSRCLNCGAIEDEVISTNRVVPQLPKKSASPRHHRGTPFRGQAMN
jgi:reverse gyrase